MSPFGSRYVPLAVTVALTALWVSSYRVQCHGWLGARKGGTEWEFYSRSGRIYVGFSRPWPSDERPLFYAGAMDVNERRVSAAEFLRCSDVAGFGFHTSEWHPPKEWPPEVLAKVVPHSPLRAYGVLFPYWILVAPGMFPLAVRFLRALRRYARTRLHRCTGCGYDLRATPGRCPECGTEPAAPAPSGLTPSSSIESRPSDPAPGEERAAPSVPAPPGDRGRPQRPPAPGPCRLSRRYRWVIPFSAWTYRRSPAGLSSGQTSARYATWVIPHKLCG